MLSSSAALLNGLSEQPAMALKESMMVPLERRGCWVGARSIGAPLSRTTVSPTSERVYVATGGVPYDRP